MPAKKTTPRVKKSAGEKRPARLTSAISPRTITILVICVLAGGIIGAARQQSRPKDLASAVVRPDAEAIATPAPDAATKTPAVAPATDATSAMTPASPAKTPPVTVTGCLERDDAGFRLKDTSGSAAPKTRSWKSGFLKKASASIDLVDAAHALGLGEYVGRRVSVTGTLVDREMRARSLRTVAASCN